MTRSGRPASGDPADQRARLLVAVATASGDGGRESALRAVCQTATETLDMRGAAVQLASSAGLAGAVCGTDEAALRMADLAFTVGEGPAIDAITLRRPVLVADLQPSWDRWPAFVPAAVEQGVRGVSALPLQIGGSLLGVLELHAERVQHLGGDEQDLAVALARLSAHIALGDLPVDGVWEHWLDHRAEVHQAQGMVMVDLGIDLAEALLRMRAFAFAGGIDLLELAHEIIGGFVLPAAEVE